MVWPVPEQCYFEFTAGADAVFNITVESQDGTFQDFTGVTPRLEIRKNPGGAVVQVFDLGNGGFTVSGNTLALNLTAALTADIPGGGYDQDLRVESVAEGVGYLWFGGCSCRQPITE